MQARWQSLRSNSQMKMYKSEKSAAEFLIEEELIKFGELIRKNKVTIKDAEMLAAKGFKILHKCEELRLSRDNWRNKYEVLKSKS